MSLNNSAELKCTGESIAYQAHKVGEEQTHDCTEMIPAFRHLRIKVTHNLVADLEP